MFKLDNNLLEELGLGQLPVAEKNKMLAHIYQTLEMRVGMRLAEKMSDEQLDEFERFIDGDLDYARQYLDNHLPGWQQQPDYVNQVSAAQQQGLAPDKVLPEYTALKWLEKNFPNYKDVVAEELDKLKTEIKDQSPAIMAATMAELDGPPAQAGSHSQAA